MNVYFLIRPGNPIVHSLSIQYIENYPAYSNYSVSRCGTLFQNYFEITSYEKLSTPNETFRAIIEADFNLTLCNTEGNEIKLNNGKLKFFYQALN